MCELVFKKDRRKEIRTIFGVLLESYETALHVATVLIVNASQYDSILYCINIKPGI